MCPAKRGKSRYFKAFVTKDKRNVCLLPNYFQHTYGDLGGDYMSIGYGGYMDLVANDSTTLVYAGAKTAAARILNRT